MFDFDDGFRFRAHWDWDSDSDIGDLLVLQALGGDGCLDVQTLVLLDALDDGRLSRHDVRELALVRHLADTGALGNLC